MNVLKYVISIDENNVLLFSEPYSGEFPDDIADKFDWDKMIRFDNPKHNQVIFMTNSPEMMRGFSFGITSMWDINKNGLLAKEYEDLGEVTTIVEIDDTGKTIRPVAKLCEICGGNMTITEYAGRDGKKKYYDSCPICDGATR